MTADIARDFNVSPQAVGIFKGGVVASANIYDDLPDDPEEAFVYLANNFKDECEKSVYNAHENENTSRYYVDYISKILAAVRELGLQSDFSDRIVPSISIVSYDTYLDFSKDVEHYITSLQIRRVRRQKGIVALFDTATKAKLHHALDEMRDIVAKLIDVTQDKKESLLGRINELRNEIDRDRTGVDRFGGVAMAVFGLVGEGVEKTRILELLDKVGYVLWGKQNERPRLPPPSRQIEHHKSAPPSDIDDDIPF